MTSKLKICNQRASWDAALSAWDEKAKKAALTHPLKAPDHLPLIPGITSDTARYLKWKSLRYLIRHDTKRILPRYFFKHPFKYSFNLLKSYLKKKSHRREGDFFLYNLDSLATFRQILRDPNNLLIVGFSYCHKPQECPSGRFTANCIHDPSHPVCQQCFIGKSIHVLPDKNVIVLLIPTIHYLGEKLFEILETNPRRPVSFLITACEMTLEMFGDWGNMVGIKGVGVRLDGRICNTLKAFELSERGIKPGLTVVLEETQREILDFIRLLHDIF